MISRQTWGRVFSYDDNSMPMSYRQGIFHTISPDGKRCKHWNNGELMYAHEVEDNHGWNEEPPSDSWTDCTLDWIFQGVYPW